MQSATCDERSTELFSRHLLTSFQEEFEVILQERNAVSSLNDLDRLVDEARKRKTKAESEANGGPVQAPIPYADCFSSDDLFRWTDLSTDRTRYQHRRCIYRI